MAKDMLTFEYSVPLTQSVQLDGDFIIEGTAINTTTTSNGHKFLSEELEMAAPSLIGVPLLKDHNNSVDSIVGVVKAARFAQELSNIPFRAIVQDKGMQEKIKQGLINSVSVGAHVDPSNIEETEDGDIIPHNITFKELSLVAVPADAGATFGIALNNAYQRFKESDKNSIITERGLTKMSEKKMESPVIAEESTQNFNEALEAIKTLTESVKQLTEEVEALKVTEADADEEKSTEEEVTEETTEESKEEAKVETEVEDEEETEDSEVEEKGYNIIQGHNSFAYEKNSYVYN